MTIKERVPLASLTSFGVGGPARFFVEAATLDDLQAARELALREGLPLKVLGAGTNIVVPDEGVEAVVVRMVAADFHLTSGEGGMVELYAEAGARWDDLVGLAGSQGLWGIENLAGIPGSAGGALVQNIGAYGAEFAHVFSHAEVFDCSTGEVVHIATPEAALAYRTSVFKERPTLAILSLTLRLTERGVPNLAYADLARANTQGVLLTTPAEIAACVRAIRKEKFPDAGCAGSFFKNPVVTGELFAALKARYPELPGYPSGGGTKLPLAFLLDRGLGVKGYARGLVRLFERQPLVIVAERGAHARDIEELAREIEARVKKEFGITLEREVETFA